jgi:hypothetical protein
MEIDMARDLSAWGTDRCKSFTRVASHDVLDHRANEALSDLPVLHPFNNILVGGKAFWFWFRVRWSGMEVWRRITNHHHHEIVVEIFTTYHYFPCDLRLQYIHLVAKTLIN